MSTTRRRIALLVVALVVVVSGCQAPGATPPQAEAGGPANQTEPGASTNQTTDPFPIADPVNVSVEGADIDPNVGLIYDRLRGLLGGDVPAPERVRSFNSTDEFGGSVPGGTRLPSRFFHVVGFETDGIANGTFTDRVGNGYTLGLGRVAVYVSPNATREESEMLLAHELTHYIQFQNDRQQQLAADLDLQTVDGRYVLRSLLEGTAVVTTDAYLRQFGENGTLNSPYYDTEQDLYPPGHVGRWANSRYQIGTDYVQDRIDSLDELPGIYEDPPTRSRELFDPDAGGRPALAVSLAHDRERISTNRLGAAFTRFGLESHLEPERARTVAAGFGTDSLSQFESGTDTDGNYVWVTRWESAADAERFDDAIADYFDARANQTEEGWRLSHLGLHLELRTAGDDTRAIVVGSDSFVDTTVIGGRKGAVSIESQ